jgi:hypothetical protein
MRGFLVTNFRCGNCGKPLELTYDEPKDVAYQSDGITGANKVERTIFILPCKECLKPAEDAKKAIKTLVELSS